MFEVFMIILAIVGGCCIVAALALTVLAFIASRMLEKTGNPFSEDGMW